MFKFLKEKLKQGISKFSKSIEEEGKDEIIEVEKREEVAAEKEQPKKAPEKQEKEEVKKEPKKEGFFSRLFKRNEAEEIKEILTEKVERKSEEKITTISEKPKEEIQEYPDHEVTEEEIQENESDEEEKLLDIEEELAPAQGFDEVTVEKISYRNKEILAPEKSPFDEPAEEPVLEEEKEIYPKELPEKKEVIQQKTDLVKRKEDTIPEKEGKRGIFGFIREKIATKKIDEQKFEDMFWDIEVGLLENNVAVEVINKIKEDLKKELVDVPLKRNKIEETIIISLKKSISDVLGDSSFNLLERIQGKKPYVICFFGINGSGKTTSIAKIAKMLLDQKKKIVLVAADTFRAAAIDQLQIHADNLGIKMIKHDYGSDPAAVAFDAIKYAKAKGIDVVLIDTAGRLHSNTNLIDEMKKIIRVASPDLKIFVGEAITGNDCIEQATKFNEAVGIDGIILAKADIDEKGGASISVSYVTKKPILYLGIGQKYTDIKPFDKEEIINSLGLEV